MSHDGYHRFYDPELDISHGSFEVFKARKAELGLYRLLNGSSFEADKYYWWSCFPGCMPDGEVNGPFETSHEAYKDAQDF